MIGYHYTTDVAWTRIQREGLIPYELRTPQRMADLLRRDWPGQRSIWLFQDRATPGLATFGQVLFVMLQKQATSVVELECEATDVWFTAPGELETPDGNVLRFSGHIGTLNELIYHEVSYFLTRELIPPDRIRLLDTYTIRRADGSQLAPP